jgi:hypothetical protein
MFQGQSDLPWMCMGDFNEILFTHEKEGGTVRAQGVHGCVLKSVGGC